MARHIRTDHRTSSNFYIITNFDATDNNCASSNQTVISNLRGFPVNRANGDILINPAISPDMGVTGNIDAMKSMRQNGLTVKLGSVPNVAAMPVGHSVQEEGQHIPDNTH